MDKETLIKMRKAIKSNDLLLVKDIIENNEGILNEVTPFGTFLHDAVSYGKIDVVKLLIDHGIDVNKKGGTRDAEALTDAAFEGYIDIIKLLVENGAAIDVSTFARNPLFAAIYNNHFEVVKYLVDKGIDTKVTYAIGDIEECDAYEYARQYGRTEIAEYLKALR
jgi:ankyrin repeat protein